MWFFGAFTHGAIHSVANDVSAMKCVLKPIELTLHQLFHTLNSCPRKAAATPVSCWIYTNHMSFHCDRCKFPFRNWKSFLFCTRVPHRTRAHTQYIWNRSLDAGLQFLHSVGKFDDSMTTNLHRRLSVSGIKRWVRLKLRNTLFWLSAILYLFSWTHSASSCVDFFNIVGEVSKGTNVRLATDLFTNNSAIFIHAMHCLVPSGRHSSEKRYNLDKTEQKTTLCRN